MYKKIDKNDIRLVGTFLEISTEARNHKGEQFYDATFRVMRLSGADDVLPVTIPAYLKNQLQTDVIYELQGYVRSYNKIIDDKSKLYIFVFAKNIVPVEDEMQAKGINEVDMSGYVCRKPIYRKTPFGKEICDVMVAVNKGIKSFYIPVITWGRFSIMCSQLALGTHIEIQGRLQSREYVKEIEGQTYTKTVYEVSAQRVLIDTE